MNYSKCNTGSTVLSSVFTPKSPIRKERPILPPVTPPPPRREYKCEAANFLPPGSRSACKVLRFVSAAEADKHLVRVHLHRCITCLFCGERLSLIDDILRHFKQKVFCGERLIESVETTQTSIMATATTRAANVNASTESSPNSNATTVAPKPIFHLGKALLESRTRSAQKLVSTIRVANGEEELESNEGSESFQHIRAQVQADMIDEWFYYENNIAYCLKDPDHSDKLRWLRKGGPFAPYIKILRPYCELNHNKNCIRVLLNYISYLILSFYRITDWPNHMFYEVYSLNMGIDETMKMISSECGYFPPTVALAIHFWRFQAKRVGKFPSYLGTERQNNKILSA